MHLVSREGGRSVSLEQLPRQVIAGVSTVVAVEQMDVRFPSPRGCVMEAASAFNCCPRIFRPAELPIGLVGLQEISVQAASP
jgi:hypothetical protein